MKNKKVILIIMDGWGLGKIKSADAIQNANAPFVSSLYSKYPNTTLVTCGEAVGLPEGQMGNSEVGHLNIGAGRVIYQDYTRIDVAIRDGQFVRNQALSDAVEAARAGDATLHVLGLLSPGGVHSHERQVAAMVDMAAAGSARVAVH